MGHQPDPNSEPAGDPDPEPPASSGSPASSDAPSPSAQAGPGGQPGGGAEPRAQLLAGFARGGAWDARPPGPELAAALATAAGPEWRCEGASGEQLIGMLGQLAALESWAAAGKLGAIRSLIRDDHPAFLGRSRHDGLPDAWQDSLTSEIALALAASVPSADKTMRAAWELGARLPEIGGLLQNGILDAPKARLIAETFQDLSDENAGRAEALIVPELKEPPAKTWAQVERIATAIALTVDPRSGERRRKAAEQHAARIHLFRERAGTAGLSGRDLPTDQTLAAHANVCARAAQYQQSPVFAKARMDQLRATAYLDLLNGVTAEERIAHGLLTEQSANADPQASADPDAGRTCEPAPAGGPRPGGSDCPCQECDGSCLPDDDSPDDDDPDDDAGGSGPGDSGPDGGNPGEGGPGIGGGVPSGGSGHGGIEPPRDAPGIGTSDPGVDDSPGKDSAGTASPTDGGRPAAAPGERPGPGSGPGDRTGESESAGGASPRAGSAPPPLSRDPADTHPVLQDLIVPLATLLHLADTPGEGHGLGALDPDLCRTLAHTAALSPHTTLCVTVTDPRGIAIGHGCAKPPRPATPTPGRAARPHGGPAPPLVSLPARINLTISADQLAEPAGQMRNGWEFARHGTPSSPGDPGWCGTWVLTLPGGREFNVRLEPVPTYECDHRLESRAYQPNDKLRHLVQVRDYLCTFPTCSRHARDSDFEHAIPYDQGGRTCACNSGARSRKCHRVKQSPGWKVTQPRPGWHQWTTPRGRTYTQGPNRYPV